MNMDGTEGLLTTAVLKLQQQACPQGKKVSRLFLEPQATSKTGSRTQLSRIKLQPPSSPHGVIVSPLAAAISMLGFRRQASLPTCR